MNLQTRSSITASVAAVLLVLLAGVFPAAAQQQGEADQQDDDILSRADELSRRIRGEGQDSLADTALTYDAEGRRDPFRSLVGGSPTDEDQRGRLPGIAGLRFEELTLVGIIRGDDGDPVAIFHGGPESMGYFVREGMNFYNGSVHQISSIANRVVIRQRIEEGPKPFREIDINLYPDEDEQ